MSTKLVGFFHNSVKFTTDMVRGRKSERWLFRRKGGIGIHST